MDLSILANFCSFLLFLVDVSAPVKLKQGAVALNSQLSLLFIYLFIYFFL